MQKITDEDRKNRVAQLKGQIQKKILVLDGATGTALQDAELVAEDFGGAELEGCNENLVLTRPDVVKTVHRKYLDAGADIVETNTFGATPLVLGEYDLSEKAYEINRVAALLAREVCAEFETKEWPRFVAGSIGPTTKSISLMGSISFDDLADHYYVQVKGLYDGGADYFLIETSNDTVNVKACIHAIDRLHAEEGRSPLPIAVSGTIEPMGTMLAGQGVDALATALENRDLLYIGLNCATGPEFMTDHIRTLSSMVKAPISCVPNAGLPDENGKYLETPEMLATVLGRFLEKGWINVIGGCCGTHSGHIEHLRKLADQSRPNTREIASASRLSGIECLEITDEMRPILVGERTNVIGSKKFRDLISSDKWEESAEVGRAQVKKGAHIVDVCLSNPDRDEMADYKKFLPEILKKVKVPIMIDSTDHDVIEYALKYCQGKAIINSINLEDGLERFEKVVPLAKAYGAALVVGCIDDDPQQGMGVTRQRKLEIAEREYEILTKTYGIKPHDIYWDALVFPCGTGDAQYVGSAVETIEGVRLLKQKYPESKTVLGVSNVSFGLPTSGREVLNAVFLYHCVQAGLDLAIVNSEKIPRYGSLTTDEIKICEDLLWNRGDDPVAAFAAFFRSRKPKAKEVKKELALDDRLAQYIIEGTKEGLYEDLELKLKESKPLEIINGPLMNGMDTVGRLFNKNEMIVAEVLQSAEAMKAAVAYLEPKMEKKDSSLRGKIVLATVKGDVHDIGKNLVEIILSNNGFQVINLGIKIPSEQLIKAAKEHKPDLLGLSGLLVKSAQQMEISAGDLATAGINVPILVGGAALSEGFTDKRIAKAYQGGVVAYAKDAMEGLNLAKQLVDSNQKEKLIESLRNRQKNTQAEQVSQVKPQTKMSTTRSKLVEALSDFPHPKDLSRRILKDESLDRIWSFVNYHVLFYRHLGLPGDVVKLWIQKDKKALQSHASGQKMLEFADEIQKIKDEVKAQGLMKPRAVFQFFRSYSEGNQLFLCSEKDELKFTFPRQNKEDGLCISDFTSANKTDGDTVALFCVTAGDGIRQESTRLKEKGEYFRSHALAALALETAEAYAELLHSQIRSLWGFADPLEMTMMERFQAKYRGCRYSFGYPACPNLEDQALLWKLIRPEEIGVKLTDGFMMDPEASVSAIVFHHPNAKYFGVGEIS
ncbi:MAG: methionine synthase [Oligoflexia bacterium]|nr:methionine synthase [Oligoflexia bacterium]